MRVIQVLNDVLIVLAVDVDDDGLDGRVALDEHTWKWKGLSHSHIVEVEAERIFLTHL